MFNKINGQITMEKNTFIEQSSNRHLRYSVAVLVGIFDFPMRNLGRLEWHRLAPAIS
jgi:hypothetical protein